MLYNIAKRVAVVAVIFAVTISVLLIVNYIQTKSIDPLNSKAISQLMEKLQENPNDTALKEQIRALDLLARKAYFTYQWQIRTGSILLFVFVLTFLIALKYMSSLKSRLPDFSESVSQDDTWENKLLSRRYIIFIGLGLFLLAFVLGILSENEMKNFGMMKKGKISAGDFPGIDEIRKNWPGFRGPEGNGIAYHTDVPTEWDGKSNKNIIWKIPIPLPGFNSPIVWGDKIFLSGADRKNQVVYCIDAGSGKILWQAEVKDIPGTPDKPPKTTDDTGYAAPTMTTDGQRVFAIFATGDIACFDFVGKPIWAKSLGVPGNHYGHSSSLITYQDLVLVQYDQKTGGRLIAMKTDTGILVYDKPRDVEISWASPIVVNTGTRAEIILNSNPFVISYDPRTGQELWRVECMSGEIAPSPAYADGMVFVVNEYAVLAGIKIGDKAVLAWEYEDDLSEVSSPVATKNFLIMGSSYGAVSCFNSKTGERYWIHDFDRGFYSSPIVVGDRVYLMDMNGVMRIFKADKQFQLISNCELGEKAVTIPAFSPGRIYIRGEKNLFCIGGAKNQ
ncbi:MAG: PQQ-binding-like beta-propeller repeat protein [Candidatus Aminicenantes bacterium]|jgi:outer membrane protein assembly factor BamB